VPQCGGRPETPRTPPPAGTKTAVSWWRSKDPMAPGKTTQRKLFKAWMRSVGHEVVTYKWNSSPLISPILKARKLAHSLSPEEYWHPERGGLPAPVGYRDPAALWSGKVVVADPVPIHGGGARFGARARFELGVERLPAALLARPGLLLCAFRRGCFRPRPRPKCRAFTRRGRT